MIGHSMGDFTCDEPRPITGYCRVCGDRLVNPSALYCKHHMHIRRKAGQQVAQFLQYARRERGRRLVHNWWVETEEEK